MGIGMIKQLTKAVAGALILVWSMGAASAATVWYPTSADVDTIYLNLLGAPLPANATFGIFGGSDTVDGAPNPLLTIAPTGQVSFSQLGNSSWEITNSNNDVANLGLSNTFQFGYFDPNSNQGQGQWFGDTAIALLGSGDSWALTFPGLPLASLFIASDVAVVTTPIPGALALFLSAMAGLGLLGWRRKGDDGRTA